MEKAEAISIITKCVPLYDVMSKSDYIFIYSRDGHSAEYMEINFPINNFQHLTGIDYPGSRSDFYRAAINNKLNPKTLKYKNNTTTLKLEVLRSLVKLPETARWIGGFNGSGIKLHTEMLAGNTCGCMGFLQIKKSKKFVPNTALKGDIRDIVMPPLGHIIATVSKKKNESLYSVIQNINPKIENKIYLATSSLVGKIDSSILHECKLSPN